MSVYVCDNSITASQITEEELHTAYIMWNKFGGPYSVPEIIRKYNLNISRFTLPQRLNRHHKRQLELKAIGINLELERQLTESRKSNAFNGQGALEKGNSGATGSIYGHKAAAGGANSLVTQTDYSEQEAASMPYGRIEPTGYKSDLDIVAWTKKYLNYTWWMPYVIAMLHFLLDVYHRRGKGLIFLPREHGKSWASVAVYLYLILNEGEPILAITAGRFSKKRIYRRMLSLLKSAKIRADYGDVLESHNLTDGELIFHESLRHPGYMDPMFRICARMSEIIGAHPRAVFLEDIIQESFKSDESNEGLLIWFDEVVKFLCPTIGGTGTRKGVEDFYSQLFKRGFRAHKKKAITLVSGEYPSTGDLTTTLFEDGDSKEEVITGVKADLGVYTTLGCPDWPLEKLLFERTTNLAGFESQMQNNPVPSTGLYFTRQNYEDNESNFDLEIMRRTCSSVMAVDPAPGLSASADYTAMIVGYIQNGILWIVDGSYSRLTFDEITDKVESLAKEWKTTQEWIESLFFQTWILQKVKLGNVVPYAKTSKDAKILRINALKPYFIKGLIRFHTSFRGRTYFLQELLAYNQKPSTSSRHDDYLDALSMIVTECSDMLGHEVEEYNYGVI